MKESVLSTALAVSGKIIASKITKTIIERYFCEALLYIESSHALVSQDSVHGKSIKTTDSPTVPESTTGSSSEECNRRAAQRLGKFRASTFAVFICISAR